MQVHHFTQIRLEKKKKKIGKGTARDISRVRTPFPLTYASLLLRQGLTVKEQREKKRIIYFSSSAHCLAAGISSEMCLSLSEGRSTPLFCDFNDHFVFVRFRGRIRV